MFGFHAPLPWGTWFLCSLGMLGPFNMWIVNSLVMFCEDSYHLRDWNPPQPTLFWAMVWIVSPCLFLRELKFPLCHSLLVYWERGASFKLWFTPCSLCTKLRVLHYLRRYYSKKLCYITPPGYPCTCMFLCFLEK